MPEKVNVIILGDTVRSVKAYDQSQAHWGVVTNVRDDLITVQHADTCCDRGRFSESKSEYWERLNPASPSTGVGKRPTAWARILNDDEMDDSTR